MRLKSATTLIGLGLGLALFGLLLTSPTTAYADDITVCPAGPPTCDYSHVQDAVDAAVARDVIKVATGVYTGTQTRPVPPGYLYPPASGLVTQVVYLSQTLTIQGGYTPADWQNPDPSANPTFIDAQGQGRALLVAGPISPTIAGLRFTGGNASGLGGYSGANWPDHDTGGGIFVVSATAVISNNLVISNTAGDDGSGGGMYLLYSDATLINNDFISNTADVLYGGGLYTMFSDATLAENLFSNNTASWGGAVFLEFSPATLVHNTFSENFCVMAGGALNVHTSDALIADNHIVANQSNQAGGGMRLFDSAAFVTDNLITGNTTAGYGGAIHLWSSPSTLANNTIAGNSANTSSSGGLEFWLSDATLINNWIVNNQSSDVGTAMYILASYPRLLHNTIANNRNIGAGDGSAIYVDNYQTLYSTVLLTNTILFSHEVGVNANAGNTAILEGTLWGNDVEWAGAGTIVTGTINLWRDPAFFDPGSGDYHLRPHSPAVDAGIPPKPMITQDIDGEPRPIGLGYDLGADESPIVVSLHKQATPDPVLAGEYLTYTLAVTNQGLITLTATITDLLPTQVIPSGALIWTPAPLPPDDTWSETLVVTVAQGYSGTLLNRLEISTLEGALGVYTTTSQALYFPNQPPYTPYTPSPSDGAIGVPLTQTLAWQGGDPDGDPVSYTVALGPTEPPPAVGQVFSPTYAPGGLTYDTTYYWVITASDGLSTATGPVWSFSTPLTPCTPITGLALSLTNTGTIYTDTRVHVQANLSPDEADPPYSYRPTIDGAAGEVVTATAEPWSWIGTFPTTGTHTLEIAVWNCATSETQALTASLQCEVEAAEACVDLESITILGESSGYPGPYTFTTSYQPADATPPIDYLWESGETLSTSVRNLTVGTHTLIVTASNCPSGPPLGGSDAVVTASHIITITKEPVPCTQVTGVELSSSGTLYLGDQASFNADIIPDEASKPYTYTVHFGDGSTLIPQSDSADPLVFSHTFSQAGTFSLEIAVWNCDMAETQALTDASQVIVVEPGYTVYLPIVVKND